MGATRALYWLFAPGAGAAAFEAAAAALAPQRRCQRSTSATEAALRSDLAGPAPAVAVLEGEWASAGSAYATLQLADTAGAPRKLNVAVLPPLLQGALPLLLAPRAGAAAVDVAAGVLVGKGVPAVLTAAPAAALRPEALADFVERWLGGAALVDAAVALTRACPTLDLRVHGDAAARYVSADAAATAAPAGAGTVASTGAAAAAAGSAGPAEAAPAAAAPQPPQALAEQRLQQRRAAGRFDVFLCHNSADKPLVRQLGRALMARGILPWLDEWELPPGQAWQLLLERQIETIGSAAVCVGPSGFGRWHEQEMRGLLNEFARREVPVITVLLLQPGTPDPVLPLFLRNLTWVDFRRVDPDPMNQLVWGITGQRPAS